MKIVINSCHGGFELSQAAINRLEQITGKVGFDWDNNRADPNLVRVVEEMGEKSEGASYCSLEVIEIPDGIQWQIEEYDGAEWVAEKHRCWP